MLPAVSDPVQSVRKVWSAFVARHTDVGLVNDAPGSIVIESALRLNCVPSC